jgi:hypothetical protein
MKLDSSRNSSRTTRNKECFPVFYLTFKVHKTPLKTRPIVSCSGSLLYGLGIWVEDKLQKVACLQQSYFKSLLDLKNNLNILRLPLNAQLFSADAVSMYTNISTAHALQVISDYLATHEFAGVPADALIAALTLIMKNNVFTFGDTTWKLKCGTAMGTPPAPPYATLYFAIHEDNLLNEFDADHIFYKRYIDDCIGVWNPSVDPNADAIRWQAFQD